MANNNKNRNWIWIVVGAIIVILLMIVFVVVSVYNYTENEDTDVATSTDATSAELTSGYDFDSMSFIFEGETYSLMDMTYEDITKMGFTLSDDALNIEIEEDMYNSVISAYSEDGSSYVNVNFKNFSSEGTKLLKDCYVLRLTLSDVANNTAYDFSLPNGITWGTSYDDAVVMMGREPDNTFNGIDENNNEFQKFTYKEYDGALVLTAYFYNDTGLYYISFSNYFED